ncbi:MAG: hypothetical protein ABS46_09345 [Cytophagaceae bacterium SCN 52-12]|nr:MAG: hypothetical protein ABS46_09345 [Cytophagaceae bacterium SCN 52-12]
MKKILLFIFSLALTIVQASAQYAGRAFIRGNAAVTFSSASERPSDSNISSGRLDAGFSKGKFLTDQKVSGFSLNGGVSNYSYKNIWGGQIVDDDRARGVPGFSIGAGKFWQFYKHFGEQWGIYGEPSVNVGYTYSKLFENANSDPYVRTKRSIYRVGLSLAAGAYYKLSEKWWLNASIGFSNPVNLSFEHSERADFSSGSKVTDVRKENVFSYELIPSLTLPSVGFGLTYFIR